MTIVLPEVFIWTIAARSASRFKTYANMIKDTADGHNSNHLANGLLFLLGYVISLGFVMPLETLFKTSHSYPSVVIFGNYLPFVFLIPAVRELYYGSLRLRQLAKKHFWTRGRVLSLMVAYFVLTLGFATDFYLHAPQLMTQEGIKRFSLPMPILLLTYVLPHSLVWLVGAISAINLASYSQNIEGSIYRSLFRDVYKGMTLVFISVFLAELLVCSPLVDSNFGLGLGFIYTVIVLIILGYGYVYRGAIKLQKIEI